VGEDTVCWQKCDRNWLSGVKFRRLSCRASDQEMGGLLGSSVIIYRHCAILRGPVSVQRPLPVLVTTITTYAGVQPMSAVSVMYL
jgi:hypothetical protein